MNQIEFNKYVIADYMVLDYKSKVLIQMKLMSLISVIEKLTHKYSTYVWSVYDDVKCKIKWYKMISKFSKSVNAIKLYSSFFDASSFANTT